MGKHIRPERLRSLPEAMRVGIREARKSRGWSQAELGRRVGLPQMHISGIESGKIVPRYNTILDLVRLLDYDLLMVPRALVPAVQALIRDHHSPERGRWVQLSNELEDFVEGEQPLYASGDGEGESRDEV